MPKFWSDKEPEKCVGLTWPLLALLGFDGGRCAMISSEYVEGTLKCRERTSKLWRWLSRVCYCFRAWNSNENKKHVSLLCKRYLHSQNLKFFHSLWGIQTVGHQKAVIIEPVVRGKQNACRPDFNGLSLSTGPTHEVPQMCQKYTNLWYMPWKIRSFGSLKPNKEEVSSRKSHANRLGKESPSMWVARKPNP